MSNKLIFKYYYRYLKNNLQVLNLFDENDFQIFKRNFMNYDKKEIEKIIVNKILSIDDNEIYNLIDNFKEIFYNCKYVCLIEDIVELKKIPIEFLRDYFIIFLLKNIFFVFDSFKDTINFFDKKFNDIEIKDISDFNNIYLLLKEMDNNLKTFYYMFVKVFLYIKDKQNNIISIFPTLIDDTIISSKVIKAGASLSDVENSLKKISEEPYINNVYSEEDINRMEEILENKKLNGLIKSHKLKLSSDYELFLKHVKEKKDRYSDDILDKIFTNTEGQDENITAAYNEIDNKDKKKFLDYMVEKIHYNDIKENNPSNIQNLDKVFEKIINSSLGESKLGLNETDMKFILLLETINSIKKNLSSKVNNSNITLNLYKDISRVKVNDHDIKL